MTEEKRRSRKYDVPYPRRPLLTALWIPGAAVLLPLGGMFFPCGSWLWLPGTALWLTGMAGLSFASLSFCPSAAVGRVALVLLVGLAIAVGAMGGSAAQATVLRARGVARPGTIAGIAVSGGRNKSYECTVRYDGVPTRIRKVDCGSDDSVGDRVSVTEDPGGLVDPEFSGAVGDAARDRALVVLFDVALLIISSVVAVIGTFVHRRRVSVKVLGFPRAPE